MHCRALILKKMAKLNMAWPKLRHKLGMAGLEVSRVENLKKYNWILLLSYRDYNT